MVDRAFDKVRQAAKGMPAVIIRMIDALAAIGDLTTTPEQRRILLRQADAIRRSTEGSVSEQNDAADIVAHYERLVRKLAAREAALAGPGAPGLAP
jgi:uncharacterized membrane protein